MLYPPDMGSEGNEVVNLETESEKAIGLVIQRDQFPDKLFAPPKRETLMKDGTNPVYDLPLIHISEPTRRYAISYAVF